MQNFMIEDAIDMPHNPKAGEVSLGGFVIGPELSKFGYTVGQSFAYLVDDTLVWTIEGFSAENIIVSAPCYKGLFHTDESSLRDSIIFK